MADLKQLQDELAKREYADMTDAEIVIALNAKTITVEPPDPDAPADPTMTSLAEQMGWREADADVIKLSREHADRVKARLEKNRLFAIARAKRNGSN